MTIFERFRKGWSAFNGNETAMMNMPSSLPVTIQRPDKMNHGFSFGDKTIITSIKNTIAKDVAQLTFEHADRDENKRYLGEIPSSLNSILNLEANKDQTGRAFMHDLVFSLLDEGEVAVCPVSYKANPEAKELESDNIWALRVAKILQWHPDHVVVEIYDDKTGQKRRALYKKWQVALIQNPFAPVMNEPNSILKRLLRKLTLLDVIDEQSGAGKLDLIIKLPYTIKSEARKAQAEMRTKAIETQLAGSKYGIAYVDGTETITQLNRPVENNLMKQVEYLTNTLYGQLGIAQSVFDGTADEATMLNYYNRTIEPIASAIVDEFNRKFLSSGERYDHQTILFRRDPFRLVPVAQIAEIADKFTRNEILTSNEVRGIVGFKPSNDPKADELINSNLNHENENQQNVPKKEEIQNAE